MTSYAEHLQAVLSCGSLAVLVDMEAIYDNRIRQRALNSIDFLIDSYGRFSSGAVSAATFTPLSPLVSYPVQISCRSLIRAFSATVATRYTKNT